MTGPSSHAKVMSRSTPTPPDYGRKLLPLGCATRDAYGRVVGYWETSATFDAPVSAPSVWNSAYANAASWPMWNSELAAAQLHGPLRLGARAKIRFRTGLRLSFVVVEFDDGQLFTDEARLPGARLGHRHELLSQPDGRCQMRNTIYLDGPLMPLWRRLAGARAARTLPAAQHAIVQTGELVRPVTRRSCEGGRARAARQ